MTATTDHYFSIDVYKREAQVAVLGEITHKYVGRRAALEAGSKTIFEISIAVEKELEDD